MSAAASPSDLASAAQAQLQEALALLLKPTPQCAEQCAPFLEGAIQCMQGLEQHLGSSGNRNPGALKQELEQIARLVRKVGVLLENAMLFQQGWSQLVRIMSSGYTRDGAPAPLSVPGRLLVEG